jgi:aspartyl protease family protein
MSLRPTLRLSIAALLAVPLAPVWGQKVALTGVMGQRALLIIDDAAPAVIAPGQSREGVTLISAQGEQAVIEINGQRQTLRVGEMPVSVTGKAAAAAAAAGQGRIVLTAGPGGHFVGNGQINGASMRFLVDTGASEVALSAQEADRIGLSYGSGERVLLSTANGQTIGYRVHLTTVRVGEVEVYNVRAIVSAAPMPFVLLGNSFLNHFQLKRENDQLTLDKRF